MNIDPNYCFIGIEDYLNSWFCPTIFRKIIYPSLGIKSEEPNKHIIGRGLVFICKMYNVHDIKHISVILCIKENKKAFIRCTSISSVF